MEAKREMKYYEAKIIQPEFEGNYLQGKRTTVYIAVENKMDNEIMKRFNWAIISVYQIPSYKYAWYVLTKTVTNHCDCFNYNESVVIE